MQMNEDTMQTLTHTQATRQHQPLTFAPGTWPEAAAHDVRTWIRALIHVWFRG